MQTLTRFTHHAKRTRFLRATAMALTLGTGLAAVPAAAVADRAMIVLGQTYKADRSWTLPIPVANGTTLGESDGDRIAIRREGEALYLEVSLPNLPLHWKLSGYVTELSNKPALMKTGKYQLFFGVIPD